MNRLRGLSASFAQTSPNSRTYLRWCRSLPCSRGWSFHCYFRRWFSAFDFWACDRSFFFGFPVQLSSLNWCVSFLSCPYSSFGADRCLNGFVHRHPHSLHRRRHHMYLPSSRRGCCSARKWPATYLVSHKHLSFFLLITAKVSAICWPSYKRFFCCCYLFLSYWTRVSLPAASLVASHSHDKILIEIAWRGREETTHLGPLKFCPRCSSSNSGTFWVEGNASTVLSSHRFNTIFVNCGFKLLCLNFLPNYSNFCQTRQVLKAPMSSLLN